MQHLHHVILYYLLVVSSCWCLDCEAIPSAFCDKSNHGILDRMEDVEGIKSLKTEVSATFNVAIQKRQQIEGYLQSAIIANAESLKKLRSLAGMNQLPSNRTTTTSVKKSLKTALKQGKEEVEEANKVWTGLTGSVETKVFDPFLISYLSFNYYGIIFQVSNEGEGPRTKKRKREEVDGDDEGSISVFSRTISTFYKFPSIGISAEWLSSPLQLLRTRDRRDYHVGEGVNVVEFSDDGSFFISGGDDGRVLLWPTEQAVNCDSVLVDIMDSEHERSSVFCLAMSPDNKRIFSGSGNDKKLFVHDSNT